MLVVDPEQPVQPGIVSNEVLVAEYVRFVESREFLRLLEDLDSRIYYYPSIEGSLEQSTGNYLTGVRDGAIVGGAGMLAIATQGDRTIYAAPFIPFKERSAAMKFGGAALAAGGAVLAALWPSQPALQSVAVRPTHGGIRASKTFSW